MRSEINSRPVRWADRTLTVLKAARLEACEKELAGLGGCGLFDQETTDMDAERLFEQSWYAGEEKEAHLHTIEEMRVKVLSQFPAEMGLLSPEEYDLVVKAALFGGEMPIFDGNDLIPARSLIRRMWCRARPERGHWIAMPRQLCAAALMMLASEELKSVREIASDITETVDNTLYLVGMMPAEIVIKDMAFRLQGSMAADRPDLYSRMLKASFETVISPEGQLMLVHAGLAEPRSLPGSGIGLNPGLSRESMEDLYSSLMDLEDPLYDRMLSLIQDVIRPETSAEDAVEDLILLAKQGAPVEEMRQVLGEKIICLPTKEMLSALQSLHDRIPRWFSLKMERVQ